MKRVFCLLGLVILASLPLGLLARSFEGEKGDVNNDGSRNVLDMLTIGNHMLGITTLDEQALWRADLSGPVGNCDGDSLVDIHDMVKIADIILGNDRCLGPNMTDVDGNVYETIIIGGRIWTTGNLRVTRYRNGDSIPNITDHSEWSRLSTGATGAWCSYNNDATNVSAYGLLYNWFAVGDPRQIAPEGWHVPSDAEWQTLVEHLGGAEVAGGMMKTPGSLELGDGLWRSPNTGATNESGFSALPGGQRIGNGFFSSLGQSTGFWSSTEAYDYVAWFYFLNHHSMEAQRVDIHKLTGLSIRCVKD